MSLFNKIFSSKRKTAKPVSDNAQCSTSSASDGRKGSGGSATCDLETTFCLRHAQEFPADRLRLVIFREGDRKERRLLFDSTCVRARRCSEGSVRHSGAEYGSSCPLPASVSHSHSNPIGFFGGFSSATNTGAVPSVSSGCAVTSANAGVVNHGSNSNGGHVARDGKFEILRARPDTKMLEELIFGAVSMSYKGDTVKLHQIKCPPQLMLTKVFPGPKPPCQSQPMISENCDTSASSESPRPQHESDSDRDSQYSTLQSLNDLVSLTHTIPMDIPDKIIKRSISPCSPSDAMGGAVLPTHSHQAYHHTYHHALHNNGHHSQQQRATATAIVSSASHGSFKTSPNGHSVGGMNFCSLPSTPSTHSLRRRWMVNRQMSLEGGIKRLSSERLDEEPGYTYRKRCQFGIAVLLSFNEDSEHASYNDCLQRFFFSHIQLIEKDLNQLQEETLKAVAIRSSFIPIVFAAWAQFVKAISDLYNTPRLREPVWLSMMSRDVDSNRLAAKFILNFVDLIVNHETKTTNFFLSTLLTAVLCHHLTWVSSVAPALTLFSQRRRAEKRRFDQQWVENKDASHPYNACWMQLVDAFGGIAFPPMLTRTLIVGLHKDIVIRLLFVISYFLRCSEVYEQNVDNIVYREFHEKRVHDSQSQVNAAHKNSRSSRTPSMTKRSRHSSSTSSSISKQAVATNAATGEASTSDTLTEVEKSTTSANTTDSSTKHSSNKQASTNSSSQRSNQSSLLMDQLTLKLVELQKSRDLEIGAEATASMTFDCHQADARRSAEASCAKRLNSSSNDENCDENGVKCRSKSFNSNNAQRRNSGHLTLANSNSANECGAKGVPRTSGSDSSAVSAPACVAGIDSCGAAKVALGAETALATAFCGTPSAASGGFVRNRSCSNSLLIRGGRRRRVSGGNARVAEATASRRNSFFEKLRGGSTEPQAKVAQYNAARLEEDSSSFRERNLSCPILRPHSGAYFSVAATERSGDEVIWKGTKKISVLPATGETLRREPYTVPSSRKVSVACFPNSGTVTTSMPGNGFSSLVTSSRSNDAHLSKNQLSGGNFRLKYNALVAGLQSSAQGSSQRDMLRSSSSAVFYDATDADSNNNQNVDGSHREATPDNRLTDDERSFAEKDGTFFSVVPVCIGSTHRNSESQGYGTSYSPSVVGVGGGGTNGPASTGDFTEGDVCLDLVSADCGGETSADRCAGDEIQCSLDSGISGIEAAEAAALIAKEQRNSQHEQVFGEAQEEPLPPILVTNCPFKSNSSTRSHSPPPATALSSHIRQTTQPPQSCNSHPKTTKPNASSKPSCTNENAQQTALTHHNGSNASKSISPSTNLGHSLMGGFSDSYRSHFVLLGTKPYSKLLCDVMTDIVASKNTLLVGDLPGETACVIADTNEWNVTVVSSQNDQPEQRRFVGPSHFIVTMIENVKVFHQLNMAPDFCLLHIEECLSDLYFKSTVLSKYIEQQAETIDTRRVTEIVGCDMSDLPLLMAIATVHSPEVMCTLKL